MAFTQLSDNYEPAYLRARSLVALERFEDADMAFDAALALKPNDPEIWAGKGAALLHTGHYDAAIDAYDHLIALTPDDPAGPMEKGRAACRSKEVYRMQSRRSTGSSNLYRPIPMHPSNGHGRSIPSSATTKSLQHWKLPCRPTRKRPKRSISGQHRSLPSGGTPRLLPRTSACWCICPTMQMHGTNREACSSGSGITMRQSLPLTIP